MNHPDPIIETRNRWQQIKQSLAAVRSQRASMAAELERLQSSIVRLEIEVIEAEDAYTAALNASPACDQVVSKGRVGTYVRDLCAAASVAGDASILTRSLATVGPRTVAEDELIQATLAALNVKAGAF